MDNKVFWLRLSYWVGAIADGLTVIPMLFPSVGQAMFGGYHFVPTPEYLYAMRLGAALMLGWTFLLLWADRKPLERKGILLLTLFPVLSGIIMAGILLVASGVITFDKMVPLWILQTVIFVLFAFSYLNARRLTCDI